MHCKVAGKRLAGITVAGLAAVLLLAGLSVSPPPAHGQTLPTLPVNLGSAVNYGVLGETGITSTGATVVNGDLGVGPSSVISGFPPGVDHGSSHSGDPQAAQAEAVIHRRPAPRLFGS
jgi:hypothetical protein